MLIDELEVASDAPFAAPVIVHGWPAWTLREA